MLDLFEEYKSNGQINNALLVGRNLLNRNPGDPNIFRAYFDFLCTLSNPLIPDSRNFAEEANTALAFYSENADLSIVSIEEICEHQERINNILTFLDERDASSQRDKNFITVSYNYGDNVSYLEKLNDLKGKMQGANSQAEFDEILQQIGKLDEELLKDDFSDDQSSEYESLTKDFTELIQNKMRDLEQKKSIAYNKEAADAFASAFKRFRKDENKYKDQDKLFSLASTTLFAYDAARLFNETLIYYNHVYSYIFSKLDDDGKFALTRYSIECERKLG
ncbi:hypothetical protein DSECCO2_554330 [anaerobic digester metagenome]